MATAPRVYACPNLILIGVSQRLRGIFGGCDLLQKIGEVPFYRNNYKTGVSGFEAMLKNVANWWFVLSTLVRTGKRPDGVLCYPDYPGSRTIIRKVCRSLGLEVHNRPDRKHRVALVYQDATVIQPEAIKPISKEAINYQCLDISKDAVDEVFFAVFGYGTRINPKTWTGRAVEKSLENAVHDGKVVDCPVAEPRKDAIYQVLIDNSNAKNEVVDMRVAITGNELSLLYLKHKSLEQRFTNETHLSQLAPIHEHLSDGEVTKILQFTKAFGLDYGELDVLRDRASNRIYIVDVNKTAYGPPAHLSRAEAHKAVRVLAESFKQQFLK